MGNRRDVPAPVALTPHIPILANLHPLAQCPPMPRLRLAEPLVMLATVVQWLALSMLTGAVVGVGCSIFLRFLFAT